MELALYKLARSQMECDPEWAPQIVWAETVTRPVSADAMARELIFVIANSGMKFPTARLIFRRVMEALEDGQDPFTVFKHPGKSSAMAWIWKERARLFQELPALTDAELPDWCGKLPHIGKITRWHGAKNLGANVAKPDRWLERVAAITTETVDGLCARLSHESGDRIATVDLVVWWAMVSRTLIIDQDGKLRLR